MNKLMASRLELAKEHTLNQLTTYPLTLTKTDGEILLEHFNSYNRVCRKDKVRKYREAMDAGEWDDFFLEGNILTFAEDLQILSAQHRLRAFVESTKEEWEVAVTFVNRSFWLESTQETRTQKDRLVMLLKHLGLDTKNVDVLIHVLNQLPYIQRDVPQMQRGGQVTITEDMADTITQQKLVVDMAITTIREAMPAGMTTSEVKALVTLLTGEIITKEQLPNVAAAYERINTYIDTRPDLPKNHLVKAIYFYRAALGLRGRELLATVESTEAYTFRLH